MRRWLPLALLGVLSAGIVVTALAAPWLAPRSPLRVETASRLKPPGTHYRDGSVALLGTDQIGRDVLSRIVHGARVSLSVGFAAVVAAGTIGLLVGLVSGYYGGWTDTLVMRLADIQLGFPGLVLAIAITAVLVAF